MAFCKRRYQSLEGLQSELDARLPSDSSARTIRARCAAGASQWSLWEGASEPEGEGDSLNLSLTASSESATARLGRDYLRHAMITTYRRSLRDFTASGPRLNELRFLQYVNSVTKPKNALSN